ncbi:MAG: UDP-N-acetylmuramate--L-alanine ligase [Phycisphaerae bacterium]
MPAPAANSQPVPSELRSEVSPHWISPFTGKAIHLIGIGGCGMCGLAAVLKRCGARLGGSDRQMSASIQRLLKSGVPVAIGQAADNLPACCDLVVCSAAIGEENPELRAARHRGIPVMKYAAMLGELMRLRSGIAIAGTHGKSTTTALLAYTLKQAGRDPTFVVGASVDQLDGSSGVGDGRHFVAEACEFDRSFLHLTPERAAILNIEEDHLDCYSGLDGIEGAFREFAARVPDDGLIVANGEDRVVARSLDSATASIETFGFEEHCTWQARDVHAELGRYRFKVVYDGQPMLDAALGHLTGRHHVMNALSAVALAYSTGVHPDAIALGLATFRGAQRRLTVRGEGRGITVLDDYGHHPTEIQVTLRAIRERYPGRRIWLIFQPHQHSRTRFFLNDFARCFGSADHVIVPDIYFVRDSEAEREAVCSGDLVDRIRANGGDALYLPSFEAIFGYVMSESREGDVVVTMGAGDVWKISDELARWLQ